MKLKAKRPVTHKGKTYQPGQVFDAPDHEAKDLVDQGHAEEHHEDDPSKGSDPSKPTGGDDPSKPPAGGGQRKY